MIRLFIISYFVCCLCLNGWGQEPLIRFNSANQPLNVVLIQLRNNFGFKLSYNETEVSKYRVSVSGYFNNNDELLSEILKDLPFQIKKSGSVYILISQKRNQKTDQPKPRTVISGQVIESGSSEPLPFSNIVINNQQLVSDVTGAFNFIASSDSTFHLKISHLGYYVFDTILNSAIHHKFRLSPFTHSLSEITVVDNPVERAAQIGEEPGKMKLNHTIARFLPGQGDNSLFNLLRLMPGIQAAGEQSTDLLIWGSYEGQSMVTLDGFTLFGLKNYNDNISVVNPFWVKGVEVYKGGYDARFGNRVGGLIDITGKSGNLSKPAFSFNINQTTLNGMLEVPVLKKSTLMLAYRQTYYNLYNNDDFNIFAPTRSIQPDSPVPDFGENPSEDFRVFPDSYRFRDFNFKYSLRLNNSDQFSISFYGGGDKFDLSANAQLVRRFAEPGTQPVNTTFDFDVANYERNKQQGMSAFYNKMGRDGNLLRIILSHSGYSKTITDHVLSNAIISGIILNKDTASIVNEIRENSLRLENTINLKNGHQIEIGAGVYNNHSLLQKRQAYSNVPTLSSRSENTKNRGYFYIQDNLPVNGKIFIKSGLRVTLSGPDARLLVEPRLITTWTPTASLRFSTSVGSYSQFLYKTAIIDRDRNYTYIWQTNAPDMPILKSEHAVVGLNYFKNYLTINTDIYYKLTRNISRQFYDATSRPVSMAGEYITQSGRAKAYGMEIFVKKDIGRHSLWGSYSLGKAAERFPSGLPGSTLYSGYVAAPHDQRHELKVAAIGSLGRFHLSANYVFGSGMEILKNQDFRYEGPINYNRVDAALTYQVPFRLFRGEAGISVLNLLDTHNIKTSNLKNVFVTDELGFVKIYSEAVPFTPTLFLKLLF